MVPKSITIFQILAWSAVGLSALFLLIGLVGVIGVMGYLPRGYYGPGPGLALLLLLIPTAIVVVQSVLIVQISRRRSAVARGLYTGLSGLLILLFFVGLIMRGM